MVWLLIVALPFVPFAIALFFCEPVLLALAAVGVTMVASERTITAVNVMGFNILDSLIVAMIPVTLMRLSGVRERLYRKNVTLAWMLWVLGMLAGVGMITGQFADAPLRSALRDFRFYAYLLVTFHFAATLDNRRALRMLALGWGVFALLQLWMISQRWLIYNVDEAGTAVFGEYVFDSATHFLPVKSVAPLFLALGLLIIAGRRLKWMSRLFLSAVVAGQLMIVSFTYSRSLYIATAAAVLALVLLSLRSFGSDLLAWVRAFAVSAALAVLLVASTSIFAAGSWQIEEAIAAIQNRAASAFDTDSSIDERRYGMSLAAERVREHPIVGTGLGSGSDYWAATEFHNSYLWMARSIGAPAAVIFILTIALCSMSAWIDFGRSRLDDLERGLWAGFAACFAALVTIAAGQPAITNITYLVEWGLLIGLLSSMSQRSASAGEERRRVSG